jgi:hypothetical protein
MAAAGTKEWMTMNMLGLVGRTTCRVTGVDNDLCEVVIPEGALMQIVSISNDSVYNEERRYTVRLLEETGREDSRFISYDSAWDDFLVPEPGIPRWLPEDSAAASAQGWDIFDRSSINESTGDSLELERYDDDGRFKSDEEAWQFVWKRAVEYADSLALRALVFLKTRAPGEYTAIKFVCTKKSDS